MLDLNSSSSLTGASPWDSSICASLFDAGLHHAIRCKTSSHSSRLGSARASSSLVFFEPSSNDARPIASASILKAASPRNLVALIERQHCTSLYSYTLVTVVSAHPISTTSAERRPAATVV